MFRKILVATDFGEASDLAVDTAVQLAKKFDASVTLTHTYEIPTYTYPGAPLIPVVDISESIAKAAQAGLDAAVASARAKLPGATGILRNGIPWRETLEVAKQDKYDLLVVGTHGRRGLSHALLGSVAEKIVRMSPIPVLTVHGKAKTG
jgi:nucleotide-binding universal stress UspA family protein